MIVGCPACQTRYLVDEAELGGEAGRRVRCASCGNLWHYSAEAAAIHLAVAAITAELTAAQTGTGATASLVPSNTPPAPALRAEPGTQVQPLPTAAAAPVRPDVMVVPPIAARRPPAGETGLAVLGLAAAVVVVVILARDRIVAVAPSVAGFYRTLHLAAPPRAPLRIASTLTRTEDSLTVAGDIVNNSQQPQPVARLRVTLHDGAGHSLQSRVIAPPVARLPPGVTAYYSTTFANPSITAAGADVAFAGD